ncbi:ubiquitin-conjugating enzyme E2Q-like protein 1 isoform X1 [Desmodus rotundus]|uniref:ubiquitin-conjugating enzyme E2Q-like protein 1 isoform X1 n=1 Tax=Desmodus rotundus TaxID=9430 RepID=UPI00238155B8|nr:ubiquitin-conjugating enzyme E2Q-like protein 1 isoform X1 [Desmodus rotundus]
MATLLRKIGLIRLHNRDTEDPKHHHNHRGGGGQQSASLRGKSGTKSGGHKQQQQHPPGGAGDSSPGPGKGKGKRAPELALRDKPPQPAAGAVGAAGAGGPRDQAAGARAGPGPAGAAAAAGGSLVPAARQQHCTQVRSRRLMKELQDIARLSDRFISVELVDESLFDWNVKLHQVDKDSVLWQDMKETNTEFILLNLTFPDNFPFSPPFMRVLSPRLENGYVLDGGAICMELLTPRGWSSAYTVEAVMRQFAASLVKGQIRETEASCWLFLKITQRGAGGPRTPPCHLWPPQAHVEDCTAPRHPDTCGLLLRVMLLHA